MVMQLWALGRAADATNLAKEGLKSGLVSSSNLPMAESKDAPPRPLTVEEIADYVKAYGVAAKNFMELCGGDGVELHAGNGECSLHLRLSNKIKWIPNP